ncbi:hypothetical protein OHB41_45590 [Streptomyces sp. NBC_01571]|uniref:hypothetical protein n=1 Tax=Streptomyces sp. NBC_01571 TaxID=2975883 RepID=UPI00225BB957|nr:hypothetical protein [Streptomyces sp. NBC_01571]MCX4580314.1 hypothetical protein [Streptomyces sp. NBC_01571]
MATPEYPWPLVAHTTGQACSPARMSGHVAAPGRGHVRTWVVVLIGLLGFWHSHTFLAPAIESGTRSGVNVVNRPHT